MNKSAVPVVPVDEVLPFEGAEAFEIIPVNGHRVVTGKGWYSVGDLVVHVPKDIVIPSQMQEAFAEHLVSVASDGLILPLRSVLVYLQHLNQTLDLVREVTDPEEISEIHIDWTDLFVTDIADDQLVVFLGFDLSEALGIVKYEEERH